MSDSITLISGCSSGIGLHSAIACAKAGHTVVATMRRLDKARELTEAATAAGVEIELEPLDITDPDSIDACVGAVLERHGRIDALVNNAGSSYVGTLEQTSAEILGQVMDVNFTGHAQLTRAVLPSMRSQGSGSILSITSVGGVVGQPFNDAYCAAKFATEGLMESLAPVAKTFGINVTLLEPGPVASEFVSNITKLVDERLAATGDPYHALFSSYVERTKGAFANAQHPDEIAEAVVSILADPAPAFRNQSSSRATAFAAMKLSDLDGSTVQSATSSWITPT
ncbi:MAG: SDR family oxidoreductase [Acidimicrobiales bacterium]|nr:SDR family oxidoreductase [Acidimicrobiales bacterium]